MYIVLSQIGNIFNCWILFIVVLFNSYLCPLCLRVILPSSISKSLVHTNYATVCISQSSFHGWGKEVLGALNTCTQCTYSMCLYNTMCSLFLVPLTVNSCVNVTILGVWRSAGHNLKIAWTGEGHWQSGRKNSCVSSYRGLTQLTGQLKSLADSRTVVLRG